MSDRALTLARAESLQVPALVADVGPEATKRFFEFFTEPITVAAYIEQHPGSAPTVKQHMAAIRMFFSYLTEKGVLAMNPAREVKTERFSRKDGKTPAFARDEVR